MIKPLSTAMLVGLTSIAAVSLPPNRASAEEQWKVCTISQMYERFTANQIVVNCKERPGVNYLLRTGAVSADAVARFMSTATASLLSSHPFYIRYDDVSLDILAWNLYK